MEEPPPPVEFDLIGFCRHLFHTIPLEPHSLSIQFQPFQHDDDEEFQGYGDNLNQSISRPIISLLQSILNFGMKYKHGMTIYQIHELSSEEYERMRRYFHSFGWDFDLVSLPFEKEVTDYTEEGTSYQRTIHGYNRQVIFRPYSVSVI